MSPTREKEEMGKSNKGFNKCDFGNIWPQGVRIRMRQEMTWGNSHVGTFTTNDYFKKPSVRFFVFFFTRSRSGKAGGRHLKTHKYFNNRKSLNVKLPTTGG